MGKYKRIDRRIYSEDEVQQMVYLLKYKNKYKIEQNLDGTFEIVCNFGKNTEALICVYNFPLEKEEGKNILMFCRTLKNGSKSAFLLKNKLKSAGVEFTTHQEGDFGEISILFNESDLREVEDIFKIKKRRIVSAAEKQRLTEQLKKARAKI